MHDALTLVVAFMVPLLLLVGCIIPPSLSVDNQDAGVNSPPAILSARTETEDLFEGDTLPLTRGTGTMNLELLDTDVGDTLQVRIFLDYDVADPLPARTQKTAPVNPEGGATRSITIPLSPVCTTTDDGPHNMTVVVFDRIPLESGDPEHQAMPEGGLSTTKWFKLICSAPPT